MYGLLAPGRRNSLPQNVRTCKLNNLSSGNCGSPVASHGALNAKGPPFQGQLTQRFWPFSCTRTVSKRRRVKPDCIRQFQAKWRLRSLDEVPKHDLGWRVAWGPTSSESHIKEGLEHFRL